MLLQGRRTEKTHTHALIPLPIMHCVAPSPPTPFPFDSLLPLRMLQQLVEHLRLLHVAAPARGRTDGVLRYHGLGLQVHGVVPVRRERRRWSHVTHVLWCHGPDHVRICETGKEREVYTLTREVSHGRATRSFRVVFTPVRPCLKVVCSVSNGGAGGAPIR